MNLVFKVKVIGFIAALLLGGLLHLISGLFPGNKNEFEVLDYPEISSLEDGQAR